MLRISVIAVGCGLAWFIAPHIPTHSIWTFGCVLLGLMAGIPAACMVAQNAQKRRVDVYHHKAEATPVQPTAQPTPRITQRAQRYIVVGQSAAQLPVGQNKIEVSR